MGIWRTFAKRVGYGLVLLVAVLVLNFLLITIAPGDIADSIAGDMGGADAEVIEEIRTRYGLDKPFYVQLWRYLSRVAVLDLGHSYFFNVPVTELVLERLPATLLLVFSAQILAIVAGTLLGVIAAQRPNGVVSLTVTFLSLFGFVAPVFWTGILLIIAFVSIIPVFPVAGMVDVTVEGGFVVRTLDVLHESASRSRGSVPLRAGGCQRASGKSRTANPCRQEMRGCRFSPALGSRKTRRRPRHETNVAPIRCGVVGDGVEPGCSNRVSPLPQCHTNRIGGELDGIAEHHEGGGYPRSRGPGAARSHRGSGTATGPGLGGGRGQRLRSEQHRHLGA